jgi:hypothetical protein
MSAAISFESLYEDEHLQAYAAALQALRTPEGKRLADHDLVRLSRCVDRPQLAHEEWHYWQTLIVDRRQTFSTYLWPRIKNRTLGKATSDDVLAAIHAAAERTRDDERILTTTLQRANFL